MVRHGSGGHYSGNVGHSSGGGGGGGHSKSAPSHSKSAPSHTNAGGSKVGHTSGGFTTQSHGSGGTYTTSQGGKTHSKGGGHSKSSPTQQTGKRQTIGEFQSSGGAMPGQAGFSREAASAGQSSLSSKFGSAKTEGQTSREQKQKELETRYANKYVTGRTPDEGFTKEEVPAEEWKKEVERRRSYEDSQKSKAIGRDSSGRVTSTSKGLESLEGQTLTSKEAKTVTSDIGTPTEVLANREARRSVGQGGDFSRSVAEKERPIQSGASTPINWQDHGIDTKDTNGIQTTDSQGFNYEESVSGGVIPLVGADGGAAQEGSYTKINWKDQGIDTGEKVGVMGWLAKPGSERRTDTINYLNKKLGMNKEESQQASADDKKRQKERYENFLDIQTRMTDDIPNNVENKDAWSYTSKATTGEKQAIREGKTYEEYVNEDMSSYGRNIMQGDEETKIDVVAGRVPSITRFREKPVSVVKDLAVDVGLNMWFKGLQTGGAAARNTLYKKTSINLIKGKWKQFAAKTAVAIPTYYAQFEGVKAGRDTLTSIGIPEDQKEIYEKYDLKDTVQEASRARFGEQTGFFEKFGAGVTPSWTSESSEYNRVIEEKLQTIPEEDKEDARKVLRRKQAEIDSTTTKLYAYPEAVANLEGTAGAKAAGYTKTTLKTMPFLKRWAAMGKSSLPAMAAEGGMGSQVAIDQMGEISLNIPFTDIPLGTYSDEFLISGTKTIKGTPAYDSTSDPAYTNVTKNLTSEEYSDFVPKDNTNYFLTVTGNTTSKEFTKDDITYIDERTPVQDINITQSRDAVPDSTKKVAGKLPFFGVGVVSGITSGLLYKGVDAGFMGRKIGADDLTKTTKKGKTIIDTQKVTRTMNKVDFGDTFATSVAYSPLGDFGTEPIGDFFTPVIAGATSTENVKTNLLFSIKSGSTKSQLDSQQKISISDKTISSIREKIKEDIKTPQKISQPQPQKAKGGSSQKSSQQQQINQEEIINKEQQNQKINEDIKNKVNQDMREQFNFDEKIDINERLNEQLNEQLNQDQQINQRQNVVTGGMPFFFPGGGDGSLLGRGSKGKGKKKLGYQASLKAKVLGIYGTAPVGAIGGALSGQELRPILGVAPTKKKKKKVKWVNPMDEFTKPTYQYKPKKQTTTKTKKFKPKKMAKDSSKQFKPRKMKL